MTPRDLRTVLEAYRSDHKYCRVNSPVSEAAGGGTLDLRCSICCEADDALALLDAPAPEGLLARLDRWQERFTDAGTLQQQSMASDCGLAAVEIRRLRALVGEKEAV